MCPQADIAAETEFCSVSLTQASLSIIGVVTTFKREGLAAGGGQIIDSTIIPVPKQHNRREENAAIKRGEQLPQGWEDNPARLRQKDRDARRTKKNQASFFGYKNSISIDASYGLIRSYQITPANVHDSQLLPALLDGENSDP